MCVSWCTVLSSRSSCHTTKSHIGCLYYQNYSLVEGARLYGIVMEFKYGILSEQTVSRSTWKMPEEVWLRKTNEYIIASCLEFTGFLRNIQCYNPSTNTEMGNRPGDFSSKISFLLKIISQVLPRMFVSWKLNLTLG